MKRSSTQEMADRYAEYFPDFIKRGIEAELLDERLAQFDLSAWPPRWMPDRDLQVRLSRTANFI